jgi:preprotein translocase subunit SecD
MKLPVILTAICIFGVAAIVFASPPPPPVFQIRLADDRPTANSDQMTCFTQNQDSVITNIIYVQKTVQLDQSAVASARAVSQSGQDSVRITFTTPGAKRFAEITHQNIRKRLAIIINGQLCEAPVIATEISGGVAQISGGFTEGQAEAIANQINQTIAKR